MTLVTSDGFETGESPQEREKWRRVPFGRVLRLFRASDLPFGKLRRISRNRIRELDLEDGRHQDGRNRFVRPGREKHVVERQETIRFRNLRSNGHNFPFGLYFGPLHPPHDARSVSGIYGDSVIPPSRNYRGFLGNTTSASAGVFEVAERPFSDFPDSLWNFPLIFFKNTLPYSVALAALFS
jgi:hypothetical protein